MNKKEIIRLFLKNDILLSPKQLEKINENNYREFLKKRGKEPPKKEEDKKRKKRKTKMDAGEFIKNYNKQFTFLKQILLKKTEAVSINKGRKVFSEVTIIGRVKEKTHRGFVIEDVTGETEVMGEDERASPGDVIAVRGSFRENRFFPKQIIWPDIPLGGGFKTISTEIALSEKEGDSRREGNKPRAEAIKKTAKNGEEIDIFVYSPEKEVTQESASDFLKKRTAPTRCPAEGLIEKIPQIFWIKGNGKNWSKNYKGVVMVSTDGNSTAVCKKDGVSFS